MESFYISIRVISPLFLWMLLGYILRSGLKLDDIWIKTTNKLIFRMLLPLLLFRSIAESNFTQTLSGEFAMVAIYILVAIFISFLLLMAILPRYCKVDSRKGVIVQGIVRSNTALYGVPIGAALFGSDALGTISLLVALVVPLFNVLSVIALARYSGSKTNWSGVLKNIMTNPLIIAIILGFVWSAVGPDIPEMVRTPLWSLADCATPLSFLALGASFSFRKARLNQVALIMVTTIKLIVLPLIWIVIGVLLELRGVALGCVLIIFAPPTGISSYPMACAMGGDAELCSEIVVFTSAFSVLSMFGWVWALQSLGLL